MPFKTRRESRYQTLRISWFTRLEARELSVLPRKTPALRAAIETRLARRARFEKIAARKVERGVWSRADVQEKWLANLTRLYTRRDWRVKEGATGKQRDMPKGSPNPWAMYRSYVRSTGGTDAQGHVSPWQLRQIRQGKTLLDKGLIFIQKQERAGGSVAGVPKPVIQEWIRQKDEAIAEAKGARKTDLKRQRENLRRQL